MHRDLAFSAPQSAVGIGPRVHRDLGSFAFDTHSLQMSQGISLFRLVFGRDASPSPKSYSTLGPLEAWVRTRIRAYSVGANSQSLDRLELVEMHPHFPSSYWHRLPSEFTASLK